MRLLIWNLIRNAKQGRVIVMTTHSMEEAEALSDTVGIMSRGELKCFGSTVHLKGKFGGSIVLNVLTKRGNSDLALA